MLALRRHLGYAFVLVHPETLRFFDYCCAWTLLVSRTQPRVQHIKYDAGLYEGLEAETEHDQISPEQTANGTNFTNLQVRRKGLRPSLTSCYIEHAAPSLRRTKHTSKISAQ